VTVKYKCYYTAWYSPQRSQTEALSLQNLTVDKDRLPVLNYKAHESVAMCLCWRSL